MVRVRPILAVLVVALITVGMAEPARASGRPDNGRIAFGRFDRALGDFSIWVANPDGTRQKRLTTVPSFFSDWSPDGRRIAFDFADDHGVHIATMSASGRHTRQLTFGSGIQEVPKWSPDGRWIAFNASPLLPDDPAFRTSIWVMRADGSRARQITHDGFDVEPVFSPDGRQIAFGRITGATEQGDNVEAIYVVNTDGSRLRQVVAPRVGLEHPDWSPDGRWITFNIEGLAATAPGAGAILAVRPNGKGLRTIRHDPGRMEYFKPVWSPDGRKLLTGCYDVAAQVDKLCTLNANGHQVKVVVDVAPDPVNFPSWGSHPRH